MLGNLDGVLNNLEKVMGVDNADSELNTGIETQKQQEHMVDDNPARQNT